MATTIRWRTPLRAWALVAGVALVWCLAFPYSEAIRNANEVPRLLQAVAIADGGQLSIDQVIAQGVDPGPDLARCEGKIYPNKPPAVAVLGALLVKAGDLLGVQWTMRRATLGLRLLTGLLPTLLMLGVCARYLQERVGGAVMCTTGFLYVMATPVLSYCRLAYGHALAAALSMMGVVAILSARQSTGSRVASWARAGAGGALCALAISADYTAVFWGLPLGVALGVDAWTQGRWRIAAAALGGAVLGIVPLCIYHVYAFGSVWSTGYHHSVTPAFAQKHGQGLLGLTWPSIGRIWDFVASPGAGLVWWIPLGFVGMLGLWHEQRGAKSIRFEARLLLGVCATGLLVNLGLNFDGGWRVGPRYLQGFVPALLPGLALALARLRSDPITILWIGSVAMYSLWVNVAAASLWPHFDLLHVNSPVSEVLIPLLDKGYAPYGLARWLGGTAPALGFLVAPVAMAWIFFGKLQFAGYRTGLAWLCATLLGTVAAQTLPSVVGAHPDGPRNLAYIESVFEPRRADAKKPRPPDPVSRPLPRLRAKPTPGAAP